MDTRDALNSILDAIADPVFVKDRQHRWTLMNDSMCAFIGHRREELIGKSDYDFFPKAEADVFWSKDEEVFKTGVTNTNEESFTDAAGVQHIISTKKTLHRNATGDEFLVGVIRDITDLKRGEEAQREHHSILRSFYESVPFMIGIVEIDGDDIRYISANAASTRFLHKTVEDMQGVSAKKLGIPAGLIQEWIAYYQQSEKTHQPIRFECRLPMPEGARILSVTLCFILCTAEGRSRFSYIAEDVTERKKMEQSMRQSEKMVAMGQLAAGVAHEINNPMSVILGFAQSLLRRFQNQTEACKSLESIEREAKRCQRFVKNMLTFSRNRPGDMTDEDPITVVDEALTLVEAKARMQKIDVIRNYPSERSVFRMERNQIQQVVINLCFNAIDAMPEGGTLLIKIEKIHGKGFEIHVRDSGGGIPPEIQKRIFEPFFTTKNMGEGTGLGLSIVQEIVSKYHGTLTFESQMDHGTTFKAFFPLSTVYQSVVS